MNEGSIIVKNLVKTFKAPKNFNSKSSLIYALNDISFSLEKGQILGIIGKNGSGKTTLLRTISGIYNPTSGNITVNGKLAPVLQIGIGFRNEVSCVENIIMYGLLLGLQKDQIKKKIRSILEFADLKDFAKMKLKYFSSGMRTRLAFATAIQIKSEIFLVDEILAVGDMDFKQKSFNEFMRLKRERKTIIHTTHNLSAVEKFSDKVLFLDKGKQIEIGDPKKVVSKYKKYILGE